MSLSRELHNSEMADLSMCKWPVLPTQRDGKGQGVAAHKLDVPSQVRVSSRRMVTTALASFEAEMISRSSRKVIQSAESARMLHHPAALAKAEGTTRVAAARSLLQNDPQ